MHLETVLYNIQDSIAKITLNRPDAKNAINLQMAKDLFSASLSCSTDPRIRVLIIAGAGDSFCIGGDVKDFNLNIDVLSNRLIEITTYLHSAISILSRINVPVIVGIKGITAGAGIGLACSGDIIVASESALFTMAYTGVGLSPDAGATYFLPRIIGLRKSLEMVLTNRQLSALEAKEIGLVSQVVPDSNMLEYINSLASQLSTRATKAIAMSKILLHRGCVETLETQMENERKAMSEMGHTYDASEGIRAFCEKRKPQFQGR